MMKTKKEEVSQIDKLLKWGVRMKKNDNDGNESITSLKGADRVRLRPGVIFGSDGLERSKSVV